MRHWWQLATRNWRVKPGRTLAITVAVMLGTATVVAVTSIYASVEATVAEEILDHWLGQTHLSIETAQGHWGNVDPALIDIVADLEHVTHVTGRYKLPMSAVVPTEKRAVFPWGAYRSARGRVGVDVIGIDPNNEYAFRSFRGLLGSRLADDDRGTIIFEQKLAKQMGLSIGDEVDIEPLPDEPPVKLTIVGLLPARRVAFFQRPTVYLHIADAWDMRGEHNRVSVIDVQVAEAEPELIERTAEKVREILRTRRQGYLVSTATSKLKLLLEARRGTRLVLLLFASVALLTSFFIILTTMSMGMMQRVRQLGTIRCLGATRGQLAWMIYIEVLPLGIVGALLGLPAGIALTELGAVMLPEIRAVIDELVVSRWGLGVAFIGGVATTIAGASAVLLQGANVSPMRAVLPQARSDRLGVVVAAAIVGGLLLVVHQSMVTVLDPATWLHAWLIFVSTGTLYLGYMLIAPLLVVVLGSLAVNVTAPLLGIRRALAQDQVGRAPWRSAGVCWTLMVGLSLIVYFFIRGASINQAWDFPSKLAGTFVWSNQPVPMSSIEVVRALPGINSLTPINDVTCAIKPKKANILSMFNRYSIFAAGEPDTFLQMAQLDFLQGNLEDAEAKMRTGGYLLLTPEASHSFGYNLGDQVPVTIADRTVDFEVAGVVKSPAMDIAVTYFQADSYMMLASASSVLGTIADLQEHFDIDTVRMFMMNIDLPGTAPPPEFDADTSPVPSNQWLRPRIADWLPRLPHEQELTGVLRAEFTAWATSDGQASFALRRSLLRYRAALRTVASSWAELTPQRRWEIFCEQLVLETVKTTIARPTAMVGSLRRIKQEIDEDVRRATLIASAIPFLSMVVASLGVANLMLVNVASRARQIAVMRAIGATRSQIARLVLVEALVLGLLGSGVGVLLGMHAAYSMTALIKLIIGLEMPWVVPWPRILGAVVLTWGICLVAGIIPAMRASRSAISATLQQG